MLGWLQEGSRSVGPFRFGLEFLGRLLGMRGLGEAQLERASSRAPLVLEGGAGSGVLSACLLAGTARKVVEAPCHPETRPLTVHP